MPLSFSGSRGIPILGTKARSRSSQWMSGRTALVPLTFRSTMQTTRKVFATRPTNCAPLSGPRVLSSQSAATIQACSSSYSPCPQIGSKSTSALLSETMNYPKLGWTETVEIGRISTSVPNLCNFVSNLIRFYNSSHPVWDKVESSRIISYQVKYLSF